MDKYLKLKNAGTSYAKHMDRLSKRVFGEVTRPTTSPSMKVVKLFSEKPVNKRPEIISWYPRHTQTATLMKRLREYGLYRDEHQDFKEEYERLKELRGKKMWVPLYLKKKQE